MELIENNFYIVWIVVIVSIAFGITSKALQVFLGNQVSIKNSYKRTISDDTEWLKRNIMMSLLHATVLFCWTVVWFAREGDVIWMDTRDGLNYATPSVKIMVAFSAGYFVYDQIDVLANAPQWWQIIVHHFMAIGISTYNLKYDFYLAWHAVAFFVEFNTIFLHTRKLMQLFNVSKSDVYYRVVVWLNLLTFLPCRFGLYLALLASNIMYLLQEMPKIYGSFILLSNLTFLFLYVDMIIKLVNSDIIKFYKNMSKREIQKSS